MQKAIFIDKDGTLIHDVPFNVNPDFVTFEPKAIEGLLKLCSENYLLIIITNQPGLALGYFNEDELDILQLHIINELGNKGVILHGFYYCPHYPEGSIEQLSIVCDCRKPKPGLILKAASDFAIDLRNSWMIGDILNDVEAGNLAGCKSILVDNGNETEWIMNNENRKPFYVVSDLCDAADRILKLTASSSQRSGRESDA